MDSVGGSGVGQVRPPRRTGGATTSGGGGGPPTGPAGGDLSGSTYPNPVIASGVVTRSKTAPDCWLPPVPVDPTDVTKVLTVAAGPTVVWQPPAVAQGVTAVWNYRTADGTTDPGARNLSPDVAAAPTMLRFSKFDTNNADASNVLLTTNTGDVLILQQRTDATKWSKVQVRAPVVNHGTWFEVPITVLATSGAGVPTNNQDVAVQFQRGTGATTYPPGGPAGGDLTGTYPNPTIAAGAVTDPKITSVAYAKVTGAPSSLPPSGAAGGDLAGSTYPNPVVAAGAITAAKIAAGVIPTTLPPSGAAGGDLAGSTYPNPVIAAGAVTDAKITSVAYAKVTGAPTALPPSGAASGSLAGTYPAPTIAASAVRGTPSSGGTAREIQKASIWAGDDLIDLSIPTAKLAAGAVTDAKVTDVAYGKITGHPTSYPPSGAASGDLGGTYPGPTIAKLNGAAVGTTTPLARGDLLVADGTPALKRLALGAASTVLQSNGSDAVWGTSLGGPPSGAAGGALAGTYPNPTIGAQQVRGTPSSGGTAREIAKASIWGGDDLIDLSVPDTKISALAYGKLTGAPTSLPPSGAAGGDLAGTYPNPTIGLRITTRNFVQAAIPAFNNATITTYLKVVDLPSFTPKGGWVHITAWIGGYITASPTGGNGWLVLYKNGTILVQVRNFVKSPVTTNVYTPIPTISYWESPTAAVATVYSLYVYQEANVAIFINEGLAAAVEFA